MRKLATSYLLFPIFILFLSACDPIWKYSLVDTVEQNSNYPDNLSNKIKVSLLASSLSIELELTNQSTESFMVDPNKLRASDAMNNELKNKLVDNSVHFNSYILDPGKSCTIWGSFEVTPIIGWWSSNKDLEFINITFDGLSRGEETFQKSFKLKWDQSE